MFLDALEALCTSELRSFSLGTSSESLANSVQAAHASTPPILHRDLKPSNVMLTAQHTPKVIDFGLCREFLEAEADTLTSKTGSYLYMVSPKP